MNSPVALLATLLTILTVTGCQPATVVNVMTPDSGYEVRSDIAYGDLPRQRLDLYVPNEVPLRQSVVVYIHGGAWEEGDKSDYKFVGQAFAEMGYITALPNYRLYPHVEFPDFITDVADAIAAIDDQVADGQCPSGNQIILIGHSAGAHTAAMLAAAPEYLSEAGADIELGALIGLAGPYDLPLDDPEVKDKFDSLENQWDANPIQLATETMPPTLLLHGSADKTVDPLHTERFYSRLAELGVPVEKNIVNLARHIDLVGGLAKPLRIVYPVYDDITQFLQEWDRGTLCN